MTPTTSSRLRGPALGLLLLACVGAAACDEEVPTSADLSLLPPEPLTVEIELPWDAFGSALEVYGGYSGPEALQEAIVARTFAGSLNAHTLMRFTAYPTSASVRDPSGTLRTDTNLSYFGGYLVAFFDTIASTNTGPVTLGLGALQSAWHAGSATWTSAIDTVGDRRAWPEPGAGPVTQLDTRDWDPAVSDSVQFFLDSADVASWSNASDPANGARVELLTDDVRLRVIGGALRLNARSSIAPDTVLVLTATAREVTFVYDPLAPPPTDGMRIGGAPAWRTVLDVAVPEALTGPPELCAAVGCPFALAPRHVSYAALALRTRTVEAPYQPTDSISLDVRPVLNKGSLPKSPLGNSLIADPLGLRVAPILFGAQERSLVEVPVTGYVRAFLAGADQSGRPPPSTLAILSAREPARFAFGSFYGPEAPEDQLEPVLKLVLTVSPPMELQ